MKKYILAAILLTCKLALFGQFDPQVAHYMFFNSFVNPAAVGSENLMKVTGSHRIQWVGIPNAAQTTYFQFQSPFLIQKTEHGIGVRFMNDNIGLFSNQSFHVQYAFKYKLGNGCLSVGTDLGFLSIGWKGDSIKTVSSDYHDITGDVQIPSTQEEDMVFDMSLGVYYRTKEWYAGVSYTHVGNPVIEWDDHSFFTVKGAMYLLGGYDFTLVNRDFALKPSLMVYTDFASWQYNLATLLEYKQKYRGGLSLRLQDAIGIMLGMDVVGGLSVGYTYELPITTIIRGSSGSHELFLSYGFDILRQKKTSKYKSIRVL